MIKIYLVDGEWQKQRMPENVSAIKEWRARELTLCIYEDMQGEIKSLKSSGKSAMSVSPLSLK